ncbi:MAG: hypothetical protein PVF17_13285 [Ignavibacteria bacterium]|jgi:hypothetical protein
MNLIDTIFNWFKTDDQLTNPTKHEPRRPKVTDWTDSLQINSTLTKGLYHNSYPGFKLAGSMCYTPIAVPVWFMGVPFPKLVEEDEELQEILDELVDQFAVKMTKLHTQVHRDGTLWVFPSYSAKEQKIIWEFIEDDSVTDIIRDINTREIIEIITDEQLTVSIAYNQTAIVSRRRSFTKSKISVTWSASGSVPSTLKDKTQRNILGILPIVFANNCDSDNVRGFSDYERILSDLKDYHDIDLKRSLMLAKFDPKMIQYCQDVAEWKKANSIDSLTTLDIASTDLIFNLKDVEDTKFIFPERAHEAYQSAQENKFRKIVEGSGIPEILWGTKVTGNLASADNQIDLVVKLVDTKRNEKRESYKKLFLASLQLTLLSRMSQKANQDMDIIIEWSNLDAISEETKSIIFKNFAAGAASLINSAGVTKEQLWKLWVKLYPGCTEDDINDFVKGLDEMARHKQYQNTPYEIGMDLSGEEPLE